MARNTTIIRSNYLWDESAAIYEHALKLWERLPAELDYDFLFSQRGVLNLAHTPAGRPRGRAPRRTPTGSTGSTPSGSSPTRWRRSARSSTSPRTSATRCSARTFQPRAGIAKHDHVAWALRPRRRRARRRPDPGLRGHRVPQGRRPGRRRRDQPRPRSTPGVVGLAAAGHSSVLAEQRRLPAAGPVAPAAGARLRAARAGPPDRGDVEPRARLRLPGPQGRAGDGRRRRRLQRLRPARLVPRDRAPDGGRRRAVPGLRAGARAAHLGRHRRRLPRRLADHRRHARSRTCTSTAAGAPAASRPRPAAGWAMAHTMATGEPHPLNAPFALERFTTGALIDEHGAAAVAH